MSKLGLRDFQQTAVNRLVEGVINYFATGPDRIGGRDVPYVAQLKAVTGAGKTPIIASAIGRLKPAIILWTTKFGSVVDQTATNLRPGGKYYHLLNDSAADIIKFTEIPSAAEWRRILDQQDKLTILISTVAAWNSSEKDPRLNVHKVSPDWGSMTRWNQLRTERSRPLWVVYDEAHNSTAEQVDLLDELDPAGFIVASASNLRGKLQAYLTNLGDEARKQRIIPVRTRDVVLAGLLKSTIDIEDFDSSADEMLIEAAKRRKALNAALTAAGSSVRPKAIYVVETSKTRPAEIWQSLVQKCNVDPESIAVCTNTKELPKGARRVATIANLNDSFLHIIFNKKLQEGWDDPAVYVCYFDGQTESATRMQQVIGRAMRQPGVTHFHQEDLNTAFFYIRCPNEKLEAIIDDLKEELRIYKDADDPDDFEPFQFKESGKKAKPIPLKPKWAGKLVVPVLQTEIEKVKTLEALIRKKTFHFGAADRKAKGRAFVRVVSVKTGDVQEKQRDLLEDSRVRCGQYLQDQIRALSRPCVEALDPEIFSGADLDLSACLRSKALDHYRALAQEVVALYENHVQLCESVDPAAATYTVGAYQPSGFVDKKFKNAAHTHYDAKAFRSDELQMANALDRFANHVWARNKDRLDYGIPLPIKSESSTYFYPDFLWWVRNTVWAIDPTGKFILDEKLRTKLLITPAPLRIALVTPKSYDKSFRLAGNDGWTLMRHRPGLVAPETFADLPSLLETLESEAS